MGFWDVTKRILQGRTAFEAPPTDDRWDDDNPTDDFADERSEKRDQAAKDSLYDEQGNKHLPIAQALSTRHMFSGDTVEIWSLIRNQSERTLTLDKMMLLGARQDLNYPLQPGQEREFRLYRGPRPTHDSYKKAELYYRDTATGDYFRADHLLVYKYEADKTYSVTELNLITPIYDI